MPRRRARTNFRSDGSLADRRPLDDLFTAAYGELRRLAVRRIRPGDGCVTLSPTALVNEAWIRLEASPHLGATSSAHFKWIAARAMRQVLIEAARRRHAQKRAGGAAMLAVTLETAAEERPARGADVLALDAALQDLARIAPRQALLVEYRYFGGLTVAELAELLDVSPTTVERDWRVAKAWLRAQLEP
jgi:RNA polymerase sigma-70 factor, ECF subfamily